MKEDIREEKVKRNDTRSKTFLYSQRKEKNRIT